MKRRIIQLLATLFTNPYWQGFVQATIYKGSFKRLCHPGMQCYSCPSSITACPLGALQNSLANFRETLMAGNFSFGFFMIGFFGTCGMLLGRLICGFLCPFGFFQDLLFAIPTPKIKLPKWTGYGKFLFLFVLVLFLPIFSSFYQVSFSDEHGDFQLLPTISINKTGATYPWFCKLICPAGTFEAGIPKVLSEPEIRESLSFWFRLKWTIMVIFLFLIVVAPRAFCRTGCPIGAIYGLFNRYSLFQLTVNASACTKCGRCEEVCPFDLKVHEFSQHSDCIRCLQCVSACPSKLIKAGFIRR